MIRSNIIALLSAAVFTGGVSAERSKKRKTHHYTQMTMKTLHLFWVLLLTAEVHAQDFKVSPIFADHMVLQREQDNKIWGYASKGSTVGAKFRGKTVRTQADAGTGKWSLKMPAGNAGGPFELTLKSGGDTVVLKDVLVGEVWVCSGQSNMEARLGRGGSKAKGMENKMRTFIVQNKGLVLDEEKAGINDEVQVAQTWAPCSPQTAGAFSNVGFHFGKVLADELDVPIGLISCDVGGSKVEAWMSREELRKKPESATSLKTFLDNAAKGSKSKWIAQWDSCLYSTMLKPIIGYGIRGVVWYQGESNRQNGHLYKDHFERMITQWRTEWKQGDFPFYYVQIAPFGYKPHELAGANLVRQAQREGIRDYKNAGMAVTADIGNWKNIHPGNKDQVGQRLSLWALAKTYGKKDIVYSGPLYKSAKFNGNKAVISFDFAEGLNTKGDKLTGVYIAGDDKVFHPAEASITGSDLVVSSPKVKAPKSVRYGWGLQQGDFPANLYNKEQLPASPFRTDSWEVKVGVPEEQVNFSKDGIHPSAEGARHMAATALETLKAQGALNNALVPKPKLERDAYDWYQRHEDVKAQIKKQKVDLVFIGDSTTHMWGGLPKTRFPTKGGAIWNKLYAPRNAVNMGFGWDRTQNVLWRLENGEFEGIQPKVVAIMIGTNNLSGTGNARNNTPAEIAEGIEAVCAKIHEKSPKTKILLQAILPRRFEVDHPWRKQITETNAIIKGLDKKDYVTFINFGTEFLNPDNTLKKELMLGTTHLNTKGYEVWAKAIEPTLKKLLGE
jgi:sialate O-acetylesterase